MSLGTLGGFTILGSSTVAWAIREGVRPVVATFDLAQDDVAKLLARGLTPTTLILGDGPASITIQYLYVLQQVAGAAPALGRVQVADRRWFWTFRSHIQEYNKRRKTGVQRLSAPNAPPVAEPIAPTIAYWPWSMRGGEQPNTTPTKWSATDVLDDVCDRLKQAERDTTGHTPSFARLHEVERLGTIPVENLPLAGDLATCLGRVLDYLPGVGVFVDRAGRVVFYSRSGGGDGPMAAALGPEKVDAGHVEPVSLGNIRPRQVRVGFRREAELRFNFEELNVDDTSALQPDDLYLDNVLPIPDFDLDVTINGTVQTLPMDTWITFPQALAAWGPAPFVKGDKLITLADLQRACVPFNSLIEAIGQMGVADANHNWTARITTAVLHYRRTFRIAPRWMGRITNLRGTRVGTLDFTTGTRGKASDFSDYAYLGTRRSVFHEAINNRDLSFVNNQPVFGGGAITDTMRAAPATVTVVDEDQGIIRVNFMVDAASVYGVVFPSQVELNGDNTAPGVRAKFCGPTGDLSKNDPTRPRAWDILSDPRRWPKLTSRHKASVILTAQPGLGSYKQQSGLGGPGPVQWVPINPSDVSAFRGQETCNGPILEILIGAGLETARVPWLDDWSEDIRGAFGIGSAGRDLAPITLNYGVSSRGGGADLIGIALAAVERIYHSLADRSIGSKTGTLVADIEPAGWIDQVTHSVSMRGEVSTSIDLPARVEPLQLEAYLPTGIQRIVMRLANPGA